MDTENKLDNLENILTLKKEDISDIEIKGTQGDKGADGKDGENYILTEKDKKEIASSIKVPILEKIIEKTETIIKQPIITNEIKEIAKYEDRSQIVEKLNTGEKGDFKIQLDQIEGIDKFPTQEKLDFAIGVLDKRTQFLINKQSSSSSSVSPLTTKGDLYTRSTVDARLAVGSNGKILSANSAMATGLEWITAPAVAGSTTQIQVNVAGAFGAYSDFWIDTSSSFDKLVVGASALPTGTARNATIQSYGSSTNTDVTSSNRKAFIGMTNTDTTDGNLEGFNFNTVDNTGANEAVIARITGVNTSHASLNGDMAFLTASGGVLTERMRLTSAGYFGIRTSNPRMPIHFKVGSSLINASTATYYETAHFPVIFEGDSSHRTYLSIVDTLYSSENDALLDMKTINPDNTDQFDDWVLGRKGYNGGGFAIGYTANQPNPHVAVSVPFFYILPTGGVGINTINPSSITGGSTADQVLHLVSNGDTYPTYAMERSGGSGMTDRKWAFGVGGSGEWFLQDVTGAANWLLVDTAGLATFFGSVNSVGGYQVNGATPYTGPLNDSTSTKIADVVSGLIFNPVF